VTNIQNILNIRDNVI